MSSESREARARRRASWRGELRENQTPAQLDSPVERFLSMWGLAQDAQAYSDTEATYDRASIPGRLIRAS